MIAYGKESVMCTKHCLEAVARRGDKPHVHQNRIVFLAADGMCSIFKVRCGQHGLAVHQ